MTDDEFLRHIDAHGAEPERWPPELRAAGSDAVARSPALRAALDEARAFDRLLAGTPPAVAPERLDRLLSAVGAAARALPQDTLTVLLFGRLPRRTVAGLSVALLALGWLAGDLAAPRLTANGTAPRGSEVALLSDEVATLFDGDSR